VTNTKHLEFLGDILYIIIVYDVLAKKTSKIMNILRPYLFHIQNSVFEGDLTEAQIKELKYKLKESIDKNRDSIIIFQFKSLSKKMYSKEIIGIEKMSTNNII